VWGIGRKHAKKLKLKNVTNAYQFTQLPDVWVRKEMAVVGLRLKHDLEGKPTLDLEEAKDRKMIATTRSFERRYTSFEQISERISTFTASCAEKLRRQNCHCNMITVFIQTDFVGGENSQYSRSITITTDFPTNSTIELNKAAQKVLTLFSKQDIVIKKQE
jgi:DNA polymerase V